MIYYNVVLDSFSLLKGVRIWGNFYANDRDRDITGKELIELAWMMIEKAQYMFGGMVTFLEAENEEE